VFVISKYNTFLWIRTMRDLLNIIDSTVLTEAVNPSIEQIAQQAGFETRASGNKLSVMAQIPDGAKKNEFRKAIFRDLLSTFLQKAPDLEPFVGVDAKISSLGFIGFKNDNTKVVVKDLGVQGEKSAGVANEAELASLLQSMVEKYKSIDVEFRDPRGKTLTLNNVTEVEMVGKDVKERKKADVVLKSDTKRLPVSLKKLDAETWESADTMFGKKAREIIDDLVDKGVVELKKLPGDDGYALSKEIVVEPTEEEAMNAVFGSDINPEGGIVIQTFKPEHFVQEENKITIECHAVIKTKEDIPESHLMVWLIRNNAGRLSKSLGIRGLRPMASVLTRAIGRRGDKDVILVDKDGNVVERPAAQSVNQPKRPEDMTDRLDKLTDKRLTGPGARAARSEIEPRTDAGTLGRDRRHR
jgi:hypothetical protein